MNGNKGRLTFLYTVQLHDLQIQEGLENIYSFQVSFFL